MAKREQDSAQAIADALHEVERCVKALDKAVAGLHRTMGQAAKEHAATLGIDVAPLSGGTPKPPQ